MACFCPLTAANEPAPRSSRSRGRTYVSPYGLRLPWAAYGHLGCLHLEGMNTECFFLKIRSSLSRRVAQVLPWGVQIPRDRKRGDPRCLQQCLRRHCSCAAAVVAPMTPTPSRLETVDVTRSPPSTRHITPFFPSHPRIARIFSVPPCSCSPCLFDALTRQSNQAEVTYLTPGVPTHSVYLSVHSLGGRATGRRKGTMQQVAACAGGRVPGSQPAQRQPRQAGHRPSPSASVPLN